MLTNCLNECLNIYAKIRADINNRPVSDNF